MWIDPSFAREPILGVGRDIAISDQSPHHQVISL